MSAELDDHFFEVEGIIGEGVEETGTALEMAKDVVAGQFAQMKDLGYINWRIDALTEEYAYGPNEEQSLGDMLRVSVYRLEYAFLAEDLEAVSLAENMTIDEDGWAKQEYPTSYLCVIADGGALSYKVLQVNDCVPGDDAFTEDLKQLLGVGPETAEDYYAMVTSSSAKEVEQFAAGIKEDILLKDWKSLSGKISYPIQISGKAIQNSKEFLGMDIDGKLNQEFVNAIDAESCREMFFNYQGIMMGATGQVWIADVDNGTGQWELKVIALNGLTDQIPLERVMDRVASGIGLENSIGYEKGYIGLQKDALVKLCSSKNGKYEAYGIISPEYGQRGILLNNIIDDEDNWNYFDSNWGYGKHVPVIEETDPYEVQFSYYLENGSWIELEFDTYETGTMSVRVITMETQEKLSEAWLNAFAAAYFAADAEQVQKFLAASYERDLEVYSGDGEYVQIHAIKGLEQTAECEVGETCEVSVEFKVSEDADYYTYLTVTVVKENNGWKVYDYGLEG